MIRQPEFFRLVWQLRHHSPRQLALANPQQFAPFVPADVAAQVAALQTVARKIPSWYQMGLYFPNKIALEQSSSERTALFKSQIFQGNSLLDLTCGLGVDAYFFAQNYSQVTAVEQDEALAVATRHNFQSLRAHNLHVETGTAAAFLHHTPHRFDLIFCDPARRTSHGSRVFRLADCSPNVLAIQEVMLQKAPRFLLKTAPMLDLREAMQQLKSVQKIWVVGTPDECREILFDVAAMPTLDPDTVPVEAVTLNSTGKVFSLSFTFSAEKQAVAACSAPRQFLYEPPPAVLKAGAYKSFAQQMNLIKLHPNTHLYTSDVLQPGVVGRIFEIVHIEKYDRRSICRHLPDGRAHLATRNFPDSPETMRKKLGLLDGGSYYLFGITDNKEQKRVLICKKIDYQLLTALT